MSSEIKLSEDVNGVLGPVMGTDGDWESDDGLDTAIQLLLGTDAHAEEYEIYEEVNRRGSIGDEYDADGYSLGSKIWLKSQSRNTQKDLNELSEHARIALAVLVPDFYKSITVNPSRTSTAATLEIKLLKYNNKTDSILYSIAANTGI